MKYFILLLSLFITLSITNEAYSATCSSTSRTNYTTGQTLTSTALNADFNQLVSKVNSLDGGCVTDGTLEASALSAADFATVTNGIHQGCALAYVDGNTVQVGKCILSVNGTFVKTTATTNVTWGCSGCSSEVVSTTYYVYARSGSTGTTLNLLISTTTPGSDGYDVGGNKFLGRFYNNSSGAIDIQSVNTWVSAGYSASDGLNQTPGATSSIDTFAFHYEGSPGNCSTGNCVLTQIGSVVTSMAWQSTGSYLVTLNRTYSSIVCSGAASGATGSLDLVMTGGNDGDNTIDIFTSVSGAGTTGANSAGKVMCIAK